jgi:RNA polymerase sigma-70 factor (ECF subfamily)
MIPENPHGGASGFGGRRVWVWQGNLPRGAMADIPATRPSLLVRLRDPRDEAAWSEFVDRYVPVIYGYARKQGLQDADAVDLAQEVISSVAGAVGRLEYDPSRGRFRRWLFTVVRRKLSNWRRAERVRPRGSGDTDQQRLLEQCPGPSAGEDTWEAEWEERLYAWACTQVRRDVSDVTWQAFWRTAVDGQPGKQVAADLGLSVAATYAARSRVFARLKELVRTAQEP